MTSYIVSLSQFSQCYMTTICKGMSNTYMFLAFYIPLALITIKLLRNCPEKKILYSISFNSCDPVLCRYVSQLNLTSLDITMILLSTLILVCPKGAGSCSGQGANRAKGTSRAPKANRGQQGQIAGSRCEIVQKRHFAMFVIISSLLILARHKKIGTLLPPWAKGNRGSHLLWPRCPATLA